MYRFCPLFNIMKPGHTGTLKFKSLELPFDLQIRIRLERF